MLFRVLLLRPCHQSSQQPLLLASSACTWALILPLSPDVKLPFTHTKHTLHRVRALCSSRIKTLSCTGAFMPTLSTVRFLQRLCTTACNPTLQGRVCHKWQCTAPVCRSALLFLTLGCRQSCTPVTSCPLSLLNPLQSQGQSHNLWTCQGITNRSLMSVNLLTTPNSRLNIMHT